MLQGHISSNFFLAGMIPNWSVWKGCKVLPRARDHIFKIFHKVPWHRPTGEGNNIVRKGFKPILMICEKNQYLKMQLLKKSCQTPLSAFSFVGLKAGLICILLESDVYRYSGRRILPLVCLFVTVAKEFGRFPASNQLLLYLANQTRFRIWLGGQKKQFKPIRFPYSSSNSIFF